MTTRRARKPSPETDARDDVLARFDWKNPDYGGVFHQRMHAIDWMRENPTYFPALKAYYAAGNYIDFINDWGVTFDPRNVEIGLPTVIPFVLFPKQREWCDYVIDRWRNRRPGLTEKSRDMGITWTAVALSCTLCLFNRGMAIGFGSRKEEYVDKIGTMKPILPKARMFMENLPEEFRGGWVSWRDAPYMRLTFPDTGSIIAGEAGSQIGRGDRTGIYLVDEAAHLEQPEMVDMALSQTTNCRIDMSSVNGMDNPFAQKRWGGKLEVFIFDWRDDPRKDDAWYARQCEDLDPVVVAQEIDRDYQASVHGVVIPGPWVRSAIGARQKLGIAPSGARALSLDVADEGLDKNAVCGTTGNNVDFLAEWSGKGSDIFTTVERVFEICDELGIPGFRYDADGLGADVRGDARVINERRQMSNARRLTAEGFRGSNAVHDPDGIVFGTIGASGDKGRTNKDYFKNRKAQGWWALRRRFQLTHRWVTEGRPCAPDDIISLDPNMPLLHKLVSELSQPTYTTNPVGKILINKKPDARPSPNLADAAMIRFAPNDKPPMEVTHTMLAAVERAGALARRPGERYQAQQRRRRY